VTQPNAVHAAPGTRLEQLHAQYADLKARADDAAAQLKGCTDAIKLELTQAAPNERSLVLSSDAGPALGLTYVESWRIDTGKLKAEQPYLYAKYAKKSGSWRLARVQDGGEG
jgi:predicted phage-related endonuclease